MRMPCRHIMHDNYCMPGGGSFSLFSKPDTDSECKRKYDPDAIRKKEEHKD